MSALPIVDSKVIVQGKKTDYRQADLCGKKFYNADLSDQDLSKLKMRGSLFYQCNFAKSDMTEADCTGSEFFGSKFIDTVCYRTNFTDAKLAGTDFYPKDCYGMVVSLTCKTFDGMRISPIWWLGFAVFLTLMHPVKINRDEDLVDKLIGGVFGAERYAKLRSMFARRDF